MEFCHTFYELDFIILCALFEMENMLVKSVFNEMMFGKIQRKEYAKRFSNDKKKS